MLSFRKFILKENNTLRKKDIKNSNLRKKVLKSIETNESIEFSISDGQGIRHEIGGDVYDINKLNDIKSDLGTPGKNEEEQINTFNCALKDNKSPDAYGWENIIKTQFTKVKGYNMTPAEVSEFGVMWMLAFLYILVK